MVRKQQRGGMREMEKNSTVGNVGTIKGDGWEEALMDGTLNIYTMKQTTNQNRKN